MADYKPFATNDAEGLYPAWADAIGWLIAMTVLIQIPLWALYFIFTQKAATFAEVRTHFARIFLPEVCEDM